MTIGVRTQRAKPRWLALFVIVGLMTGLTATAVFAAPPKITLDQCRNGSATAPNDCDETAPNGSGWVNGNAGASNAHFVEGHSIPYRARLTDTPSGPNEVRLGYDIKHSGVHAIDFLTHYDRLEPHGQFDHPAEDVDPTAGVTGLNADVATCAIPKPSNLSAGAGAAFDTIVGQGKDLFTVFGADSCSVEPLDEGDTSAAKSEASVKVTFDATSPTVVMAWGGHIARTADWPPAGGAAGISGSPYHMRLLFWSAGNVGNQDRSLSAAAVLTVASTITTQPDATLTFSATLDDSATVAGNEPTGTVTFKLFTTNTAGVCSGEIYSEVVNLPAGTDASKTVSTTDAGTPTGSNVVTTAGTWYWTADYSGDALNEPSSSDCGDESVTVVAPTFSTVPAPTPTP